MCDLGSNQEGGSYELNRDKIARAFRKVGMLDYWQNELSAEELRHAVKRGYSILQWKLLRYFRKMLDDELLMYKQEQETEGRFVQTTGLTFKQLMIKFPEISDAVFGQWAMRFGINHLYAHSLGDDRDDLRGKIFFDSSGRSVYERFESVLRLLKWGKRPALCGPLFVFWLYLLTYFF